MAYHLQNIYGTEQDRVNCPFYFKIGACTYGERCSRLHNKPTESQTVIIMNMYQTPYNQYGPNSEPLFDLKDAREHLDDFYEDVFIEMARFGEIEEIYVCRNLGDHLVGNTYVKFFDEDDAAKALEGIRGRYFGGRHVVCELSPVTDFREARCRQYDIGECNRGGFCNFMHLGEPNRELHDKLFSWQRILQRKKRHATKREQKEKEAKARMEREKERRERGERERDRAGERERDRDHDRDRPREDRGREREADDETERGEPDRKRRKWDDRGAVSVKTERPDANANPPQEFGPAPPESFFKSEMR